MADRKVKALIDLDADGGVRLYVVEVMYEYNRDGVGVLQRHTFDVRADAQRAYEFARDRANTEWQRLYAVDVVTSWWMQDGDGVLKPSEMTGQRVGD